MKNCGTLIHDEIATKQYMEQLKELIKTSQHENVRLKTLELIQAWAHAFRHSPKYRAVQVAEITVYCINTFVKIPLLMLFQNQFIITFFYLSTYHLINIVYFAGYIEYNES